MSQSRRRSDRTKERVIKGGRKGGRGKRRRLKEVDFWKGRRNEGTKQVITEGRKEGVTDGRK